MSRNDGELSMVAEAFTSPNADWLNPIDERGDGYDGVAARRRSLDAGPLPISLESYMEIVDWTGRQLRADQRGAIHADLAPILDRLGLRTEAWVETVTNFGKWFGLMVVKAAAMNKGAARTGVRSWGSMKYCRLAFKQSSSTSRRFHAVVRTARRILVELSLGRVLPRQWRQNCHEDVSRMAGGAERAVAQ